MELDSIILPYIGTREADYISFQYIPLESEDNLLKILIPRWVVNRENLSIGDIIDLNLDAELSGDLHSSGVICSSQYESSLDGDVYELELIKSKSKNSYVTLSSHGSKININPNEFKSNRRLFLQALKDSWMLKRGVIIYLRHLASYFSRISGTSKLEYPLLKDMLLKEPLVRANTNAAYLEELYLNAKENIQGEKISVEFDLHTFSTSLTSEIELDLFKMSFDSELLLSYITSIKNLEKRLFQNHNIVVALYTAELEG